MSFVGVVQRGSNASVVLSLMHVQRTPRDDALAGMVDVEESHGHRSFEKALVYVAPRAASNLNAAIELSATIQDQILRSVGI